MTEYQRRSDGSYLFPGNHCALIVSGVNRDRYDRLFGHAVVLTTDGQGYLAMGNGELTSETFRFRLASEGARRNSGDPTVIENHVFDATLALLKDPDLCNSQTSSSPAFVPLPDYLSGIDPRRNDLVTDLLEFGHTYLLAGRYKSGKSLLVMNLILTVARGGIWIGREVKPGPVYWLQLEDSDRVLARRWQSMAGAPSSNVQIARGPWHSSEENLDTTVESLKGAALVVVDPIIAAADVERWSDMTQVRRAYDYWRTVARETDAVIVLLAHHRKMDGADGDQVAGSHQAGAAVDGIIEMRKGGSGVQGNERRLSFTGRDWADMDDEIIALDPATLVFEPAGKYQERKAETTAQKAETDARELADAVAAGSEVQMRLKDEVLCWSGKRFSAALAAAERLVLVHREKRQNPDSNRNVWFVVAGPSDECDN